MATKGEVLEISPRGAPVEWQADLIGGIHVHA
jgi:hypothetical protein